MSNNLSPQSSKEVEQELNNEQDDQPDVESERPSKDLKKGMNCLMHRKPLPCEDCVLGRAQYKQVICRNVAGHWNWPLRSRPLVYH